ncbi:sirohydrochlorin chelatase [Staphylococcus pseudintermedius]|nr:sirohydrochlorin chelatase [Staphylococcus pseudintermedius]UAS74431.2 sirohydrochlorin chelatase [Staphylococcus pseudintermedius]UDV05470.1 sirohydrochlorin chelatase [Staphylococcus pseudintermedius]
MLRKVIFVVHGMRKGQLNETLTQFVAQLFEAEQMDYAMAFLESETASLPTVIEDQVTQGVTELYLVPLLLFSASHYYEDIADSLEGWRQLYPQTTFYLAQPLGTHPKMKNWVASQIARYLDETVKDTAVVVLAHGSARFNEPDIALETIANQLSTATRPCYPCMVYGKLNYEKILAELAQQWPKLLIIPYFFYDGYLVRRTKQRIGALDLPCDVTFTTAINFHPVLKEVILNRLEACGGMTPCILSS